MGVSTKTDERFMAMERMKTLPINHLLTYIYPDLYPVHLDIDWQNEEWPRPLQLSFANIERNGVYLLDTHDCLFLYICKSVNPQWLVDVLGVSHWAQIPDDGDRHATHTAAAGKQQSLPAVNGVGGDGAHDQDEIVPLPANDNPSSMGLRAFVDFLLESRPLKPHFFILR